MSHVKSPFKSRIILDADLHALKAENEELREALMNMIHEAELHLSLYVQAYKREPYDTGILLKIYHMESKQRIALALAALKSEDSD